MGGSRWGEEVSQAGRALRIKRSLEVTPSKRALVRLERSQGGGAPWGGEGSGEVFRRRRPVVPVCRSEVWGREASHSNPWCLS